MAEDSTLLLVEPVIFGRRAMNETVQSGLWHDSWRIHHKGSLIHAENVRLSGDIAQTLTSAAGLGGIIRRLPRWPSSATMPKANWTSARAD
jgi:urease accessory protein